MTWSSTLKPVAVIAAALLLATAVQGRQQTEAKGKSDTEANRAIAREQIALIDKAWEVQRKLAQSSRVEINDASFSLWGRRRLDALRRAGAAKAEIIAALEKYINDLKEDEAVAKAQKEAARATELAIYNVRYRRMEAEIWLNEEKAR